MDKAKSAQKGRRLTSLALAAAFLLPLLAAAAFFGGGLAGAARGNGAGGVWFTAGFESDADGFESNGGTLVRENESSSAHGGAYGALVDGLWVRNGIFQTQTDDLSWLTAGNFFELSAWAKWGRGTPALNFYGYFWATVNGNESGSQEPWVIKAANPLMVYNLSETDNADWQKFTSHFGIWINPETKVGYILNGQTGLVEEVPEFAGLDKIVGQFFLDIGTYNSAFYVDDVELKTSTVTKDAVITTFGDLSGAAVTVRDKSGQAVEGVTVLNDDGIFMVKDLEYANFADYYTVNFKDDDIDFDQTATVNFIDGTAQLSAPYIATVTLTDGNGNPVGDATLSFGQTQVTANAAGVYTLADVVGVPKIKIVKAGMLTKYITVSPENSAVSATVTPIQPATVIADNLFPDSTMESLFTSPVAPGATIVAKITDEQQYDGQNSYEMYGNGEEAVVDIRQSAGIKTDGTRYYFEAWAKSATPGAELLLGAMTQFGASPSGISAVKLTETYALTDTWTRYAVSFSYRLDEATGDLFTSLNGAAEEKHPNRATGFIAVDLRLGVSDGATAYADNVALLEMYDTAVTVRDVNDADVAPENIEFKIVDHYGIENAVTPEYDAAAKVYMFKGLKGVMTVKAKTAAYTYPDLTVSTRVKAAELGIGYDITVTLKDKSGALLTGARLTARQGLQTVGTFTDNGDGTYTLIGAMGTVSIIATKEGYTFARVDNVAKGNNVLTIAEEGYDPNEGGGGDQTGDGKTGGCAGGCASLGAAGGGIGGLGIILIAAGAFAALRAAYLSFKSRIARNNG
ncbi:MAG: carboxypeptidase-like regulatory domain-containing protein [Clostridiales bacterium]|nr:carboxypeptidase-like regulatory domain-containing protein [Clostridiales bacterium]